MAKRFPTLDEVKSAADGNWLSILTTLAPDLAASAGKPGWHFDCPLHGGKNDFRFDRRRGDSVGLSFCSCGTRNGFQLLEELNGWTFLEAKDAVAEHLGLLDINQQTRVARLNEIQQKVAERQAALASQQIIVDQERLLRMKNIWENETILLSDDRAKLGRRYLHNRKLNPSLVGDFWRFHPALPLLDAKGNVIGTYPALVAKVLSNSRVGITLHRTYLDPKTGKKLPGKQGKKMMPVPEHRAEKHRGRFVPLMPLNGSDILGITEGLETALAASELFQVPVWPTISASPLVSFEPPPGVKHLVVFADNDCSGTGLDVALKLRRNLAEKGFSCKVHIRFPSSQLLKEEDKGVDWADAWFRFGHQARDHVAVA